MVRTKFFLFLLFIIAHGTLKCQQVLSIDSALLEDTHDVLLSPWGPYSKKYKGISHIPDQQKGLRFDVSVIPGYRNKILIPDELRSKSGCFPWNISSDMSYITYRYELEWKDQVFMDVTYIIRNSSTVLMRINCVNNTELLQNVELNIMGYLNYPEVYPNVSIDLPESCTWINGISYKDMIYANPRPTAHLVYDGWLRGEGRDDDYIGGSALSKKLRKYKKFGKDKGDKVVYSIPVSNEQKSGLLCFRYRVEKDNDAIFKGSGLLDGTLKFKGTGKFEILKIPYEVDKEGTTELTLESKGESAIELNGFYFGPEDGIEKVNITKVEKKYRPDIQLEKEKKYLVMKYSDAPVYYGIAWDSSSCMVREFLNDKIDASFQKYAHDSVKTVIDGNNQGHYTNLFVRPVELAPGTSRNIYALICSGSLADVEKRLGDFVWPEEGEAAAKREIDQILPEGEPYAFSIKMMQATLLANIVFPIYTQQQYIRHFTGGKSWNSLYTWDSGFITLGLSEIDNNKAIQFLNAYTTPVSSQSAFIHHGSLVPVQMYAFFDLWNKSQSRDLLTYFYPRLKRYYNFLAGMGEGSTTRVLSSTLLKTWDYFYNSGGWDDYPAQKAVHQKELEPSVAPVVTTAHCIRAAKILRQAALSLDLKQDVQKYESDIRMFSTALQNYSWDQKSGYFSYVKHDKNGKPLGFFYDNASGKNYNMGMDGAYPIFSGICTEKQIDTLLNRIFSKDRMWTPSGIGVVDQSAPYYRADGYWNGRVWMPHQWFMWKTMLDIGRCDLAYKIAKTALDVWKKETDKSYYTCENFISETGQGAGWRQFSSLTSPMLLWFASYFKPGTVSTGFEIWIKQQSFSPGNSGYKADLSFDQTTKAHPRSLLLCLDPSYSYEAFFNGKKLSDISEPYKGLLQITLPATNKGGSLIVNSL